MRLMKKLGFVILAALAVTAIAGASSAIAEETALCSIDESPCEEGDLVKASTLHLKSGEIGLLHALSTGGSETNILCLSVLSEADYGKPGAPQPIEILSLSFGSCGTEGSGGSHSNCTVTAENLPYEATLLKTGENSGTLEVTDAEAAAFVKCTIFGFIKVECEYEGTGLSFAVDGGTESTNGAFLPEGVAPLVKGGSLCSEESEITLGMLEPLNAVYLAGGQGSNLTVALIGMETVQDLFKLNEKKRVKITNNLGAPINIVSEYLVGPERFSFEGAGCSGQLANTLSCETREIKCVSTTAPPQMFYLVTYELNNVLDHRTLSVKCHP